MNSMPSMPAPKLAIRTDKAPAAIGPYSQAIRSGDFLFSSGQVGFDPLTGQLVAGGVEPESRQVLANLAAVLQEAGLNFADVVKSTIFLADIDDFASVNDIYAGAFPPGTVPPARSTVQVARLPRDARVEIEVVARFSAAG